MLYETSRTIYIGTTVQPRFVREGGREGGGETLRGIVYPDLSRRSTVRQEKKVEYFEGCRQDHNMMTFQYFLLDVACVCGSK